MTKLHAHFDGRVLVPDEPVDLPRDRALEVQVEEIFYSEDRGGIRAGEFPTFNINSRARIIRGEEVRRAEDES